jgi:photosystem I subunit 11
VSILTVCLSIYGTAGTGPNVQPPDATIDNPPADLFTKAGWAEFASGFWLGGCGGAAFAWFLCSTAIVSPLVNIAGGVWSTN